MPERIVYDIPIIHQANTHTCWYACAQMIVRDYRRRHGLPQGSFSDVGRDVDTAAVTHEVNNGNIHINLGAPGALAQVAELANLSYFTPMARWPIPSASTVEGWLRDYGPLMYSGRPQGYRGISGGAHMVVICGITRTGPGGSPNRQVLINDPSTAPPPQLTALSTFDIGEFFDQLRWVRGAPLLHAPR